MFKNKIVITILSLYVFWIGILPFVLAKGVLVLCENYSHNSGYDIKIESPKVILSPLPIAIIQAKNLNVKTKNNSMNIEFAEPRLNIRLLPLLSGKIHINSFTADKFSSSLQMKKRFELDKDFFKKAENLPVEINSVVLKEFESKFYHQDIKMPVIYKGENFVFNHRNRYINFKNQSVFILSGNESKIDINLYLPKNNDLKKTVFDINLSNFDLASLKIYLKNYLPLDLVDLKGSISSKADKEGLVATFNDCAIIMQDPAKSMILPKKTVVKSKFNIKRQYIDFKNVDIDAKNLSLSMDGRLSDYFGNAMPTLDFNIRINKSRVEDIVKLLPPFEIEELNAYKLKKYNFYGNVLANFSIKGRMPEPDVFGDIFIDDAVLIKRIPNTSNGATLKFNLKGRALDYDVVVPAGGIEKVNVLGTQDLYNNKLAKLTVKSTDSVSLKTTKFLLDPLHEILNFMVGPLPIMDVDGVGNIDILVKGNRKRPHIWGTLNLNNLSASFDDIKGLNFKSPEAKLVFNDENVIFQNQNGKVNGQEFLISGSSDLQGKFDFSVATKSQSTSDLYDALMNSKMLSIYQTMLPKITNIKGNTDLDLRIFGVVKSIKDLALNQNVLVKGDIKLNNNEFDMEDLKVTKVNGLVKLDSNNADVKIDAALGEHPLQLLAMVKSNIADVSMNVPKLDLNRIYKNNLGKNYLLPYISLEMKYKGAVDKIEYEKLKLKSEVVASYPNSNLKFDSGSIEIENNKIDIRDFKGYIADVKNSFNVNFKINDAFSKDPKVSGNLFLNAADITIFNEIFGNEILPKELRDNLHKFIFKSGNVKLEAKVNNNNINAETDLSGVSMVYEPLDMPIKIINGVLQIRNNNLKLNKINMLADEMPILIDGEIKDILDKQNFNIYLNSKPKQDFIDKYVNDDRVYPIKIKGDIVCWAKLKGNVNNFDLKSNLNLSKEASIYYLGATVGDIENSILLDMDSKIIGGKNLKIKEFSYNKLIDSQSGRQTQLNMLKAWGDVGILTQDLEFKDLYIKTQNPTDARIFNIIFRKPNIKQGQFTSSLKFNGKSSDPKIIGDFHIFETDIPFFDTTMKNIELVFKDKTIDIASKGEVMGNEVSFNGVLKNKLTQPYYLEKGILYTKDLDLNRIFNKLKISQVDDFSTFESFDDFKLSAISFKNLVFKADNIRLRNLQATNYEANTSLSDSGIFNVNRFVFDVAQGSLSGGYRYNLKTNDMSLNLDINKISADDIMLALFDLKNQIYGDMTGRVNLSCNGTNFERCMQTLNGNSIFNVKDGRMPKLGSLEYLLKAGNLVKGGLTGLSINSVVELISPLKTGEFSDISGFANIKNGVAEDLEIKTKGKDLSLFVSGKYNFATSEADMQVFGLLSRKMSSFLGPLGNISINTLFNVIPGVDLSKDSVILEKINKIPGVELSSKDFRRFVADIKGDINGEDYVTSFNWVN